MGSMSPSREEIIQSRLFLLGKNSALVKWLLQNNRWKSAFIAQPTSEKWFENFSIIASTVGIEELENETLLNIAVGTSVTFESAVILLANQYPQGTGVHENPDLLRTFHFIKESYENGKYKFDVSKLTAWHFRYIASSWSSPVELEWIREAGENICVKIEEKAVFNDCSKIGCCKYIEYTAEDKRG